jgi:hypothetical protein
MKLTDADYDPFRVILEERLDEFPDEVDVVADALRALQRRRGLELLEPLISSKNPSISVWGLLILSELGKPALPMLNLALNHIDHKNWRGRFYISEIMASCLPDLTTSQVAQSLPLAGDRNCRVRARYIGLLSHIQVSVLNDAAFNLPKSAHREQHLMGVQLFDENDVEVLWANVAAWGRIVSSYACARILQIARVKAGD